MSKKVSIGALITLMAIIAAVTFSMTIVYYESVFNNKMSNLQAREAMYDKLAQIDQLFRNNYAGVIDETMLQDYLSSGYVRGTGDPYARYYTAAAYQRETQASQGKIMGVGVVTDRDPSGYLLIKEIYAGSTAESAGLQVGDLIVALDGEEIRADNAVKMQEALQGEAGTKVTLTIRRDSADSDLPVTRRYVEIPAVFPQMLENNIGYLKITEISDTTDEQFTKHLEKLITQGANAFIIDLRGVTDGVTDSAIHILDRLLPKGVAVTATYKDGREQVFELTDSKELTMPVVLITNEKTAREAEIIAQVMKEYGRAKIVGTKTMGKGTRQEFRSLEGGDGSAIQMSVAIYKTPKSETFHLVGVLPDYEATLTAEEEKKLAELDATTDPQMKKALEVCQGLLRAYEETNAGTTGQPSSSSQQEESAADSQEEE